MVDLASDLVEDLEEERVEVLEVASEVEAVEAAAMVAAMAVEELVAQEVVDLEAVFLVEQKEVIVVAPVLEAVVDMVEEEPDMVVVQAADLVEALE